MSPYKIKLENIGMKRSTTKKLRSLGETFAWGFANCFIGLLMACLVFAFGVAFCHIVGLDTQWAKVILSN